MKSWFNDLEAREKLLVSVGAAFVIFALFYALLWAPLGKSNARLADDIEDAQKTLLELRRVEGRMVAPSGSQTSRSNSNQSLAILVSQSVNKFSLKDALTRNNPSADDASVTVRFENAGFESLVGWLADLEAAHGLSIRSSSFNKADINGRVDATVTLQRL